MNNDIGAELRQRVARYGWEQVPVPQLRDHFDRVAALGRDGFESIKPGVYARSVDDGIVQLVKLLSFKDGTYSLQWGVSLPWMPHQFQPKPKWHRTLTSARMDLFDSPSTLQCVAGESPNEWHVNLSHGPQYMALTFDAMWSRLAPRMNAFLGRVRTADTVMAMARAQCTDKNGVFSCHHPHPQLVLAFTAAHASDLATAEEALDRYMRELGDYADAPREVLAALLRGGRATA